MGKKILVIGGSGFLGAGLCRSLARDGHQVTNYSRGILPMHFGEEGRDSDIQTRRGSILDEGSLREAVCEAEVIFHYGAVSTVKGASQNVQACRDTNVLGTVNLAKVLRQGGGCVEKLILASSISVYGEGAYMCLRCALVRPSLRAPEKQAVMFEPLCPQCRGLLTPHSISEDARLKGGSVYAKSKIAQEDILTALTRETGIPLAILRYATIYGPRQSQASPYFGFLKHFAAGSSVTITEDGQQTRDFLFVDDALDVNLRLLRQSWAGQKVLNVGSGTPLPVIDFVERMRQEFSLQSGLHLPPILASRQIIAGDVRHCNIDCGQLRARNYPGPLTALESGLKVMVKAFFDSNCVSTKRVF